GDRVHQGLACATAEVGCHGVGRVADEDVASPGVGTKGGQVVEFPAVDPVGVEIFEDLPHFSVPAGEFFAQYRRVVGVPVCVDPFLGQGGEPVGGGGVHGGDSEESPSSPDLGGVLDPAGQGAPVGDGPQGARRARVGEGDAADEAVDAVRPDDHVGTLTDLGDALSGLVCGDGCVPQDRAFGR